jgi:hypothetical protein
MRKLLREGVRPVALTIAAPGAGFLVVLAAEVFAKVEMSKLLSSVINLIVVAPVALLLFPRVLGIPFGRVATREFLQKLGFHLPDHAWKHVVLGLALAACTLLGMLVASISTGRYAVDLSTINLPHAVFCLNPALWEELFYRGVMMLLLLRFTRSLKWAFVIQVVLFGATHIQGTNAPALVDAFSVAVMAIGFTYVACKTRSMVGGVVFHYFHDALLLFVQPPDGVYAGVVENVTFYGLLWLMIGLGCVVTWLAADKMGVRAPTALYDLEKTQAGDVSQSHG